MKCPKCQAENPEGQKFCGQCGAQLERVCPKCGNSNPPEYGFCGECGQSLTEPAPETPQPAKPPSLEPTSFVGGRYQVKKLLGKGGRWCSVLIGTGEVICGEQPYVG